MNHIPTHTRSLSYSKRRTNPYTSYQTVIILVFVLVAMLISILMPYYIAALPLQGG